MAERTTKQTDNEENTTSTTTVSTTEVPTGDQASINHPGGDASPAATRQGEVAIDEGAETNVIGGFGKSSDPDEDAKVSAENIENAKQQALRNHDRELEQQPRQEETR